MARVFFLSHHFALKVAILLATTYLVVQESTWSQGAQTTGTVATVSAASFDRIAPVAPESIVSAFGANFASRLEIAATVPLPVQLGGTTVAVNGQLAQLFFVSPAQVNFLIPRGIQQGEASIVISAPDGRVSRGVIRVANVSPALFSANADGKGVAAAVLLRVKANGAVSYEPISRYDASQRQHLPIPIDPGDATDRLFVGLFGTGLRGRQDLNSVTARIGGLSSVVHFAGASPEFAGLDQVNVEIPNELVGRGLVRVAINIGNLGSSNIVDLEIGSRVGPSSPQINQLSSGGVLAGSPIVIGGTGFSTIAAENVVRIGGVEARVVSASATRLTVLVPFGAQSGSVTVRTPKGESVSRVALAVRTSISGMLEDINRQPLSGVIVSVEVAGSKIEATTGATGQFILPDVMAGPRVVVFDGSRVPGRFPYPKNLRYKLLVIAGRDNPIGQPVALKWDDGPSLLVGTPTGGMSLAASGLGQQQTRRIETGGVAFEVPNNISVAFPDGMTSGFLTLSLIENGRTPFSLPPGQFSSVVAQVTAFGATLLPGAKLTFPNRDGYAAGAAVDIIRLDQSADSSTLGSFVKTGTAVVSADGQRIETGPNAVTEASIYLVANPQTTTAVVGRVTESDGRPVRQAVVISRGQQTSTDGNGAFYLRNVPAVAGDTLTVEASFARPNGTVARGQRGNLSAVPGGVTTMTSDLTLQPEVGNRPPIISFEPLNLVVNPSEAREIDFIAVDPEEQTISVSRTGPSFSSIVNKGNGVYALRLQPAAGDIGTHNLRISAVDSLGETTVVEPSVRVNGLPVANPQTVTLSRNTTRVITLTGSDPDGEPITFTIAERPNNGRLTGDAPNLTYTPDNGFAGTDRFTFKVSDGSAESAAAVVTIAVTPVNQPPVLTVPVAQTITVLTSLSFTVTATDADVSQLLTLTSSQLPGGATYTQTGPNSAQFSWTPTASQVGSYNVSFTVTDSGTPQLRDTRTVSITVTPQVNRPPALTAPAAQTAAVGQPLSFVVSASDPDSGQTLTIIPGNLPNGASITKTSDTSIQFNWTPTVAQIGNYAVSFTVTDNGSPQLSDTKTVAISVTQPNRAPVLAVPAAQSVIAGQPLSFTVSASDPDSGQTLILTAGNLPPGASFNQNNGQFNWTPSVGQIGSYTVSFTATDNGSPRLTDTKTVAITVTQPNRAPVLTVPVAQSVVAGQSLRFTVSASDPDTGQTLILTATAIGGSLPTGATFTAVGGSGEFRWTPTTAQIGSYTISFTAIDSGTPVLSATQTVTIMVISLPSLTTFNFTTASVSTNGVVTRFAGRPTQQYEEDLGGGVKLEMVVIPKGSFTMGSPESEIGRWSFTGHDEGPQRLVNLNSFVMGKYEVTQAQWRAVMQTNPANQVGDNLPVEQVSWDDAQEFCRRLNARLGLSGRTAYRLPSEAEWEYAARAGTTSPFAFGETINPEIVNYDGGFPYGNASVGINRGKTIIVGSLGVANGWGLYDMHGNVLEWCEDDWLASYNGAPVNGSAWAETPRGPNRVFRGGGWGSYAVFSRSATRYKNDPTIRPALLGFRLVRNLPVEVTIPNRAPLLNVPTAQTARVGEPLRFQVGATDLDPGQALTITATTSTGSLPSGSTFRTIGAGGEFNWTPTTGQVGSYTISFTVIDNGIPALSETGTVVITVVQPNRPPVLTVPTAQSVVAGQPLSFTVSASDPDSGQTLTLTAGNLPPGASFSQNTMISGQLTWTPTNAQVGDYTISFTVRDNGIPIGSSEGTVLISVLSSVGLSLIDFTTATVSETGVVTRLAGTPVYRYIESLGSGVSLEMIMVPQGSFTMGSPTSEPQRDSDEGPQRQVSVNRFAIGKFEVTQAQWRAIMGTNPSFFKGDNLPVEKVTWDDVQEFCRRLNAKLGLTGSTAYRLPSEAEWEYAARAGSDSVFAFGPTISPEIVNYRGTFPYGQSPIGVNRQKTVEVGSLGVANRWGLYDMHGNVGEWCEDDYHGSYTGAPINGQAWVDSSRARTRVLRFGGWGSYALSCRSAARGSYSPGYFGDGVGFRLARTLP